MWQSIPRTGSLLLRASRPHSIQRFTRCLLSSLHALLPKRPAVSCCLLSPPTMPRSLRSAVSCCLLSSLHVALPAFSGLPAVPLSPRPRVTPTKAQQNLLTT